MIVIPRPLPKLDTYIYLAYIFFMPLGRFVYRPDGVPTTLQVMNMSTLIMLFGVAALSRLKPRMHSQGIRAFVLTYVFMVVYSLIAAVIVSIGTPLYHGHTVLLAPAENIVLYFITLLSIYYNVYCLSHIADFNRIWKIMDWSLWLVIAVGFIQIGAISGFGPCANIYSILSSYINLCPLERIVFAERGATGFGSEPSSLASMFFVAIPYLIVAIRYRWPRRTMHIIMLALFAVLFKGSDSSSVMILLLLTIICAICVCVSRKVLKIVSVAAFVGGLFVAVMYGLEVKVSGGGNDRESIEYLAYGKVVDRHNYSTMMRASTIAVDMKLISEYPLSGVGLGLQGVWYDELVPQWTRKSDEVQHLMKRTASVSNGGGAFFPVYFSAFGLIGVIVLMWLLTQYKPYLRTLTDNPAMYSFYWLGIAVALLSMWYVSSPKMNEYLCFLLAFPIGIQLRSMKTISKD